MRADFILKKILQRLDEFEGHLLGQAANVVVALDHLRRSAHGARLDHIGIKRALHQPIDFACFFFDAQRFLFKDADEFVANNFALRLRDR